jgi:dihydroorotate dehydrogenase
MDVYKKIIRPLAFALDAETAHAATLTALRSGLVPRGGHAAKALQVSALGQVFANPLGLAAGFDKEATALSGIFRLGFGFAEAGTVTPRPQVGNQRPRVFRDVANESVINRMGFPGGGCDVFEKNLRAFRARHQGIVGVNIGMNKDTAQPLEDYRFLVDRLAGLADYIAINVSSPNTAGLRDLQAREQLHQLLSGIQCPVPLLVKVSPDLSPDARRDVADLALQHKLGGLIVANTTITRPPAMDAALAAEKGGLSGALLRDLALDSLSDFYRLTEGRVLLVGVGGIASADDAWARIRAGAGLLQVYSGLVYHGPKLVRDILAGLEKRLSEHGFSGVAEAVGTGNIGAGQAHMKAVI